MAWSLRKRSTLTIYRYTEGYYQGGRWVDGALEPPFDITCNIQPYRQGEESIFLPEGTRADDVVIIYTQTELKTADQFTSTEGDYFQLDGRDYKVYAVENWSRSNLKLDHYKVYAIRRDIPTNGGL